MNTLPKGEVAIRRPVDIKVVWISENIADTFSTRRETMMERLRKPAELIVIVIVK